MRQTALWYGITSISCSINVSINCFCVFFCCLHWQHRQLKVTLLLHLYLRKLYCSLLVNRNSFYTGNTSDASVEIVSFIFTALHAMQTRSSDENSVSPSVRLSVCLSVKRVLCDKTVERSVQIYIPYERTLA